MRVCCISDLHGVLPKIPECELLIIAGDICPVWNHRVSFQSDWLQSTFRSWLYELPTSKVIAVAGNHDWIFEKRPDLVPHLDWHYLQDNSVYVNGLKIYGLPWQRTFNNWAFNLDEPELDEKYRAIPKDADIIVSHGPAFECGDRAPRDNDAGYENTGNKVFLKRIIEIQPKLVVTGHIHCDVGYWSVGKTLVINASILNDRYEYKYGPRIIDL